MELKYIILIIVVLIHVIYTSKIQKKINKSVLLSKRQKILNSTLIWVIPFFWYYTVKGLIIEDYGVMTKQKRDKLSKKDNGGFYESRAGFLGDG